MSVWALLSTSLGAYAIITGIFLISENRRPQATLAWMLAFVFAPGLGVLLYILFGRHRKAFARQGRLMRQSLEGRALPFLSPLWCRQDIEVAQLENRSPSHKKL